MTISKVAEAAGMSVKTVRYYGNIELVVAPQRSPSGYRLYDARSFGFSIEECRELLNLYHDTGRTSADVKRIAEARLAEIEQKQRDLQSLQSALSYLVHACRGDQRPECPILNYLA